MSWLSKWLRKQSVDPRQLLHEALRKFWATQGRPRLAEELRKHGIDADLLPRIMTLVDAEIERVIDRV